jgi:Putative restriction endonuclease
MVLMISQLTPKAQPPEQWFTLPGRHSWEQFRALDVLLTADYSGVRVFYLDGVIELMSISAEHELIKSILDALLVLFFCQQQINVVPMGSATMQSEEGSVSAEPDLSYRLDGESGMPELAVEAGALSAVGDFGGVVLAGRSAVAVWVGWGGLSGVECESVARWAAGGFVGGGGAIGESAPGCSAIQRGDGVTNTGEVGQGYLCWGQIMMR